MTMQRVLLVSLLLLGLFFGLTQGSSHGEAPGQVKMPASDVSDAYAFTSYETGRENWVTFLANFAPLQDGFDGPNYHALDEKFLYELNIDTTGDGNPDLIYSFQIINELPNPPHGIQLNISNNLKSVALKNVGTIDTSSQGGLNYLEYYKLAVIQGGTTSYATQTGSGSDTFSKPFDYAGNKTFADYAAYANSKIYTINIPGCGTTGKVFVGQRQESFSINIGPIFDLVNFIPLPPNEFPGGISSSPSNNQLSDRDVTTVALEVPKTCLGLTGSNTVIGFWASTRPYNRLRNRPNGSPSPQKSRLGNPLVNELLIGLPDKDSWSKRFPSQDGLLNKYITYPTFPAILDILFRDPVNAALGRTGSIAPTNFPRNDLVAIFLTGIPGVNFLSAPNSFAEMIRLNTATPSVAAASQDSIGVIAGDSAGYPNGRRPGDDVIDITLRAAMGKVCYLGLGVCNPSDAVTGDFSFTDGSPISALDFQQVFPYLNTPITSSPNNAPAVTPCPPPPPPPPATTSAGTSGGTTSSGTTGTTGRVTTGSTGSSSTN